MRRALLLLLVLSAASLPSAQAAPRQWSIVGGTPAAPAAYPFMAALVSSATTADSVGQFCGGTVIAPLVVLTAAHCTVTGADDAPVAPSAITVVLQKNDLAVPAQGGERHAVARIARHPGFDVVVDDIALLHLATPTAVTPIGLPAAGESGPGAATAIGWGATNTAGDVFPDLLQAVSLPVSPDTDCASLYGSTYEAPGMLCAGQAGLPVRNICFGDSGGPLLVPTGTGLHQVGVASWVIGASGNECGMPPAVFTRVEAYLASFIVPQLKPAVSAVTVAGRPGGVLRVGFAAVSGGAPPTVTVTTTAGPQIHPVAPGATFVDIPDLPGRTALKATVSVTNPYGTASATSAGSATVTAAPTFANVGVKLAAAVEATLHTNGGDTTVQASWGRDPGALTNSAPVVVADAAAPHTVTLPMTGLEPGASYVARVKATNGGGTATSIWFAFTASATAPTLVARPRVVGQRRVGKRLTCRPGSWAATPDPTFTYTWLRGSVVIGRSRTLRVPASARGRTVVCVTTARNVAGEATAKSRSARIARR
jgi:secreted trypsin-like serine protease